MICLKAYTEWNDLFDENVSSVWQNESIIVLKKISMLLFSLKNEIKKIEDEVDSEVSNLRRKVIETPKKLDNILLKDQSREASDNNKENTQLNKTEITISQPKHLSAEITADSPEIFQNAEAPPLGSNDSSSIIISDDDTISPVTNESPEIKKKKRNYTLQKRSHRWQKLRDRTTSAVSLLRDLNTPQDAGNDAKHSDQETVEIREQTSIIDDKSSLDFFKGLASSTTVVDRTKTNDNSRLANKEQGLAITPVKSDIDLSIVQCTPVQVSLPKRKDKSSYLSYLSKKKCKREKTIEESDQTTLTQIFSKKTTKKCVEKASRLQTTNYDSDETYFNPTHGSQASKTGSVMGITRMVSYLNKDSLSGQDDTHTKIPSQGITNLDPDTQQIANFVEDIRFEDFEDDTSLNSAIREEVDNDEEKNLSQGLNEFLAKAQNVPQQLAPEPVVRGNARKRLPGWSCKDCEKFYVNQGLNPEEILALNKCSKHRGYYPPREDTLPGFWDMNLVTQETKNTK